jgi:Histone deacetylase domain
MACTLHVAWDDRLARYDFGSWHPMAPVRVEMTMELARAFGVFSAAGVSVEPLAPAADGQLEMVHLRRYIAAVRQAGGPEPDPSVLDFGLGTEDNPMFAGMHDASALVAGATLAAARKVWAGEAWHGASIAGGLHHAMRASASGFCVYNDPAIAISWLLAAGASRVAYVDIDVHHGTGCKPPSMRIRGCGRSACTSIRRRCGPAPGGRRKRAGRGRRDRRSTWRFRPAPGTPAGCVPSTPWCRRCCRRSGRASWSASMLRHPPARSAGEPAAVDRCPARRACRDPPAGP